jgi:hypothetical protein
MELDKCRIDAGLIGYINLSWDEPSRLSRLRFLSPLQN